MKKWHLPSKDGSPFNSYCGFNLMKAGASKGTVSKPVEEWLRLLPMGQCKRCLKKYNAEKA